MTGVDIHTHLIPDLPDAALTVAGFTREGGKLRAGQTFLRLDRLYRPEALVEWLGDHDLDRAVVSIPPPLYRQHLDAKASATWTRELNDAIERVARSSPSLIPAAYLPFEHPDIALAELHHLAGENWRVFTAGAGGQSVGMDDPRLTAVWEVIETLNRPIFLHPAYSPDARFGAYYLNNLLGNPTETALAAAQLLFGGVLTRFPKLRICLAHGAGSFPALLGRWQRGVNTARPGVKSVGVDLRAVARRLYADVLTYDAPVADLVIQTIGTGHVLLGSDWPFPMGENDPRSSLIHRDDGVVKRAAIDNAAAFLNGSN